MCGFLYCVGLLYITRSSEMVEVDTMLLGLWELEGFVFPSWGILSRRVQVNTECAEARKEVSNRLSREL